MDIKDIQNRFIYHAPQGDQAGRYGRIREWALNFAFEINELTPACREQSLAITALEECVMWANAAIARHERGYHDVPVVGFPDVVPVRELLPGRSK